MSFNFETDTIININGHRIEFPWFLITEASCGIDFGYLRTKRLKGNLNGNFKVLARSKMDIIRNISRLKKAGVPYFFPCSNVSCFRLQSGDKHSLYPDNFTELKAYTIDIETTGLDKEFCEITAIGVLNHITDEIMIFTGSERTLLINFTTWLRTTEIDVLVGHNHIIFDVPFLMHRCGIHHLPLLWGAKLSIATPQRWESFFRNRYGRFAYNNIEINGIDLIDTMFCAMRYDTMFRTLPGYGLKPLEKHFGIAGDERLILTGKQIVEYGKSKDPKKRAALQTYLRYDLVGTKGLYGLLAPVEFYQTKIAPLSFQEMHIFGIGKKWNYTMLQDYVLAGHSIPVQNYTKRKEKYLGADVACYFHGRVENVHKIDVSSLYPSIMLKYDIKPTHDPLNVFQTKLRYVFDERQIRKKQAMVDPTQSPVEKSLKIFINGGYGYLGDANSMFKNEKGAEQVCTHGRKILGAIVDVIEEDDGKAIEMDTDGVIYTGKANTYKTVNEVLPEGIWVDYEGTWKVMLSYKMKNYILWNPNEKATVKGVFFKNSKMWKLKKEFVADMIDAMLHQKAVRPILSNYYAKISLGNVEVDDIKQKYNVKCTQFEYETALAENPNKREQLPEKYFIENSIDFKAGDVVSLYQARNTTRKCEGASEAGDFVKGEFNTKYYLKSLFKFVEQIYTNAPGMLPPDFVVQIDGYHYWRFRFCNVKSKELRQAVKDEKIFI